MRDLWRSDSFKLAAALVVWAAIAVATDCAWPTCRVAAHGPDAVLGGCA